MATPTGFGKVTAPKPKAEKNKAKRTVASQKYEEMKSSGLPEFSIYVRIKGKPNWIPAGSMTVDRSDKISLAIYQQEEELIEGVMRLYPKMRQYQSQLEYGYRLKQFNDEAIAVAIPPQPTLGDAMQAKLKQWQGQFTKLFDRKG
ncbi:HHL1-like protein [Pseudanabaena sp. PCC 6802]|uniref:HHL1-like protein n=1 Tax=Pseudanabaena sp. PCC 6802 TaxID=118173 RepID=UPI0003494E82|nr:HHL1-like protein [Pseudanabaena sp. PCC 6802]